jgi:PKD repeat protein
VAEGSPLTVNVTASDPDGEAISSLTASGVPSGATFTAGPGNTTGTLTWTPAAGQAGSYTVTFTAANALSGSASTVITVTDVDRAPVASAPATATVAEGSPLTVNVTASDPDGEAISSLTATGVPSGATFTAGPGNTSGTLTWTPGFTQAGSYTVTFTAANALSGSASTVITVGNSDAPPTVAAPATAGVSENQALTVNVSAGDPDGDAISSLTATGLPSGATFTAGPGNTTGTLNWTPGFAQAGSYTVTFTAANALSGSASTVITVSNVDRAPAASAPATASTAEGSPLTVNVTASDPDGDAISSLTATGLPSGATFTAGPGNTTGTLTWTPGFAQAGSYTVTFTAANALSGSASTVITVTNEDRGPIVAAPATAAVAEGSPLTVSVTASDPDGDAISSLTATGLPSGATFTAGPGNTTGTLNWTPGSGQAGSYTVTFTAANALSGSTSTVITVQNVNQPPVASLVVTPSTGNAPLAVTADASGSSDADGTIATYRFDFGDGTIVGPQTAPTAAHTYGAGNWTASVTVTDNEGSSHTRSQAIIVAAVPPEPNLVGNPSFEVNTDGWAGVAGATLSRAAGGFDGGFALRAASSSGTGTIEVNDMPNWVASTATAGATYRFTAWVKAGTGAGSVRLRVREFVGTKASGGPKQSNSVTLSTTWQLVTLDVVTKDVGSTLDFQIVYNPVGSGEAFLVDNIGIRRVGAAAPAMASSSAEERQVAGGELPAIDGGRTGLEPSLVRAGAILSFRMATAGSFEVDLLDVAGRCVRRLAQAADAAAGTHRVAVDGRGDQGQPLPPGVYFYRIQMPGKVETGRFVIAR